MILDDINTAMPPEELKELNEKNLEGLNGVVEKINNKKNRTSHHMFPFKMANCWRPSRLIFGKRPRAFAYK